MIYSRPAVYGGNEYGKVRSLVYFDFFEALNGAFEVQFFQGLIF